MGKRVHVSDSEILEHYRQLRSAPKAASLLGISPAYAWKRLRACGVVLSGHRLEKGREKQCEYCGGKFSKPYGSKTWARIRFCSNKCAGAAVRVGALGRFMESFVENSDTGCWEWRKAKSRGYGRFGLNGGTVSAHRASYHLHHGEIPDGQHVLHKCDNPSCINPDHLFLGTHQDNMADMVSKGRHAYGERSGHAKLSKEQVRSIRISKETLSALSSKYGIAISVLSRIRSGSVWKSVEMQNDPRP